MRIFALTLFFLIYSALSIAQVHDGFRWIGRNHVLYQLDVDSGVLTQTDTKRIQKNLGSVPGWDLLKKDIPDDFGVNVFERGDSLVITIPGTGHLYSLRLESVPILTRWDRTFFRGYNFNASQFFRNDTLFSIGGEGFWQRHSLVTFYDLKAREWNLYSLTGNAAEPSNDQFSGYSAEHDAFFSVYYGMRQADVKAKVNFLLYSFKKKKWEVLGKVAEPILAATKSKYKFLWTGTYLLLFNLGEGTPNLFYTPNLYIIDPFKNVYYEHDLENDHYFLATLKVYAKNGNLFSRGMIGASSKGELTLDSLKISDLVAKAEKLGPVYQPEIPAYLWFGLAALGVFLAALLVLWRQKRKRPAMSKNLELQVIETKVLKVFLAAENKKFTTAEVNALLEIDQKSYDSQRQIRTRIMGQLNQKLLTECGGKELIVRSANPEDKRMMDFYVNPEVDPKVLLGLLSRLEAEVLSES
jgi:hypothetical protein